MVTHLQAERQRLLSEVSALQASNDGQKAELAKLRERVAASKIEKSAAEGSDR